VYVDSLSELEYFPAAHRVQATDPLFCLYLPATHPLQLAPIPVHPGMQIQSVTVTNVLATGETEFAGQPTQPKYHVPILYVPAAHLTHGPPFAPFHPALQTQEAVVVLAAVEKLFAGQSTHAVGPKYVPARHWQLGSTFVAAHHWAPKPQFVPLESV